LLFGFDTSSYQQYTLYAVEAEFSTILVIVVRTNCINLTQFSVPVDCICYLEDSSAITKNA